ncbi:MAG: hypothetical protein IT230_00815 [Flavobacteriales bacterium]|nr:hypothetical protein [Flavobacteriales bacterium]
MRKSMGHGAADRGRQYTPDLATAVLACAAFGSCRKVPSRGAWDQAPGRATTGSMEVDAVE